MFAISHTLFLSHLAFHTSWLGESISRENEFSDVSIMPSECLKELRVKDREVVTLSVVEST